MKNTCEKRHKFQWRKLKDSIFFLSPPLCFLVLVLNLSFNFRTKIQCTQQHYFALLPQGSQRRATLDMKKHIKRGNTTDRKTVWTQTYQECMTHKTVYLHQSSTTHVCHKHTTDLCIIHVMALCEHLDVQFHSVAFHQEYVFNFVSKV